LLYFRRIKQAVAGFRLDVWIFADVMNLGKPRDGKEHGRDSHGCGFIIDLVCGFFLFIEAHVDSWF